MRICVTGYRGNLGSRIVAQGFDPLDCNVTQEMDVQKAIKNARPDLIIHLAGKTDVNYCEDKKNMETVMLTNLRGSANVFKYAEFYGAKTLIVSSDHVFSGRTFGSYLEKSKPNPVNYYGLTKLAVEALTKVYPNVSIIRTSTLFWSERGMIKSQLEDVKSSKDIYAPLFIRRSFLHIDHFITQLHEYIFNRDMPKVLNLSGSKNVSWFTFLRDYAKSSGLDDSKVLPKFFNSKEFAPRPYNGGLDTGLSKKLGITQYSYLDGIWHDKFK